MKYGKFIVIEGIDGAGSTTQANSSAKYLYDKDKANVVLLTREPTSLTEAGREIRRRLSGNLLPHEEVIDSFDYWANLFVGDRSEHLKLIEPSLGSGVHVISDRHMLSTLAYQSSQGGEMEKLIEMHRGLRTPDLTVYLDVPAEIALERIKQDRNGTPEYFEKKHGFLELVAQRYHKAIELVGTEQNVVTIDGTQPLEDVTYAVQRELNKLFEYE